MFVSIYYKPSLFNAHTMILIVHFFMIVNLDHEPDYTPLPPPPGGWRGGGRFYHMAISGYLNHQSTQFRLSASELLMFVSVVLVLINALYGIPNCDDLVS